MNPDNALLEMIPLAEEIRHGKGGTPEKAMRLSELLLSLHTHLFDGGNLPQAWFVPLVTDFRPRTVPPQSPPLCMLDHHSLEEGTPDLSEPFEDFEVSGVRDAFDLSDFDDVIRQDVEEDVTEDIEIVEMLSGFPEGILPVHASSLMSAG